MINEVVYGLFCLISYPEYLGNLQCTVHLNTLSQSRQAEQAESSSCSTTDWHPLAAA